MKTFIQHLFGILIVLVSGIYSSSAQYQNVLIGDQDTPEEPAIAIDPSNPQRVVAGANIASFYYSGNGGTTWNGGQLSSPEYGVWGDPCIIADTLGYFYFFHLANPAVGSWIDRIVCQRSTDGGHTWSNGTAFGKNNTKVQDKEWAIVDRATNTIYVTWTQFDEYGSSSPSDSSNILFVRSVDQGLSWSTPKRINKQAGDCVDSDNTVEGAVPAVGPDGQIYVAWAGPLGIMFDRSDDGGESWLDDDIFVSDFPGGWDYNIPGISRCNGLPVTCCDISKGPHRGTIYVNWTDQRNGETDTDVWLSRSEDGGNTWSAPIRINDDQEGKQQFFTWMTVDQETGYLWFVFYDRRNYSDLNTDVYMAVSMDGGNTFTNFKVSESPFVPTSNIFFGDYTNISAHNNIVRPIWARLQNSNLSVWTAIVDTVLVTIPDVMHQLVSEEDSYPNPFRDETYYSFKLHKRSLVNLDVMDLFGRKVAGIYTNKWLEPEKYIERFDPAGQDLPSGVYYFRLNTGDSEKRRKIIYLR
jgi:hypothetical protein